MVERTLPWGVLVEVAVVGCIDGDDVALARVIDDLAGQGVFRLWHVGDLLGGDPESNQRVVELLLRHGAAGVRGPGEESVEGRARIEALTGAARTYAEELPRERRLGIGGVTVHLFHGTPARIDEKLGPDTRDHYLARIGRRSEAQVLVYGQSRRAYWRAVGDRLFLDVGAVLPVDGQSSFGVVQLGRRPPLVRTGSVAVADETAARGKTRSAEQTDPRS